MYLLLHGFIKSVSFVQSIYKTRWWGGVGNQSLVVVLGPQLDISTVAMEGNAWAWFIFFCNKQVFLLSFKSLLLTLPAGTKPRSALKFFFHVHKTVVSPRVPELCQALPPPSSEGVKSYTIPPRLVLSDRVGAVGTHRRELRKE